MRQKISPSIIFWLTKKGPMGLKMAIFGKKTSSFRKKWRFFSVQNFFENFFFRFFVLKYVSDHFKSLPGKNQFFCVRSDSRFYAHSVHGERARAPSGSSAIFVWTFSDRSDCYFHRILVTFHSFLAYTCYFVRWYANLYLKVFSLVSLRTRILLCKWKGGKEE